MKSELKKIPRNFRLDSDVAAELKRVSSTTGLTETRIIEDALRAYFKGAMAKRMIETAAVLKGAKLPFDWPATPFKSKALDVLAAV